MSDNVLSVIPTDPRWQPGHEQAAQARDLLAGFAPDPDRPQELTAVARALEHPVRQILAHI